ncbi:MAG: phosphatidate cytidylyltransferase [Rhodospirillales bacterium]|nr:phosphatidate cytidylyltransferase [Rhodospirillales bacterium]
MLRTVSAAVLAPPVLAAIWFGTPYFEALVLLAAGIMAWEWELLISKTSFGVPGIALGLAAIVGLFLLPMPLLALAVVGGGAVVASLMAPVGSRGWMALGGFYIFIPLASFMVLRSAPEGQSLVIWLFLIVWATDIGAYVAGLSIGGPKLAPSISPKKTWAGLVGGMVAAAVIAMWAGSWFGFVSSSLKLGLIGAVLAVVAQAGDLFESHVKRRFDAKDSSQLIPGHGGLLDRVDGLLAAAFALGFLRLAALEGVWVW